MSTGTGADRADEADGPISASISSAPAWRKSAPSALRSLISLRRWSPRIRTMARPRPSMTTGSALTRAPAGRPSEPETSSIVVSPGVETSSGASSAAGSSTGWAGRGDLEVGGVAGRQGDLVLAGRARRHVLVGAGAAHHPDVGLDPVPAQPAAVEDPVVGARLQFARAFEASTSRSKE